MLDSLMNILNKIDDVMYYPVLIIILAAAGLYFSFRTRFAQIRLFGEACRLIVEKPKGEQKSLADRANMVKNYSDKNTKK